MKRELLIAATAMVFIAGCSSQSNSGPAQATAQPQSSLMGPAGPDGPPGSVGAQGQTGATGAAGYAIAGPRGAQGPSGSTGEQGNTGATGPAGNVAVGPAGVQGAAGPQGATGATGQTGAQGASLNGYAGPTGNAGPQGAQGDTGQTGAQGPTLVGPAGPGSSTAGVAGPTGYSGPAGAQGAPGATGAPGPAGIVSGWTEYRAFWFAYGSADLRDSQQGTVNEIAAYLQANPSLEVGIDGSMNTHGSDPRDQDLCDRRAGAVRHALLQAGVSADRIQMGAYGDENQRRDRRVGVLLTTSLAPGPSAH
jgi:OmpA family